MTITITKQIPITAHYDVAVCGGGPAGLMAAVAGARQGLNVALIERSGYLGGTATGGLVLPISGFYLKGRQVVGGIPFEFVQRMAQDGAAMFEMPKGNISFDPERYKLTAQEMLCEAGVTVMTNACVTDCVKEATPEGDRITAVVMALPGGSEALTADCFIDATGDGTLARLAGVAMLPDPEELQPMSLCFLLGGADTSTELLKHCIHHDGKAGGSCNAVIRDSLSKAYQSGRLPQFGGPWFNVTLAGDVLAVNVTRSGADARDSRALRDAEFALRRDMYAIVDYLREQFPEFKNAYILSSAPMVGVRETNHIRGCYTVTGEDVLSGRQFEDSVAVFAHPIDIHSARDERQQLTRLGMSAGIPYRVMVAPTHVNLICAGRNVSADRVAYASIRVQGTGMALGQAAGVAAGLFCRNGGHVADVPAGELRESLHRLGGITE